MFNKIFWMDATERAVKTLAQFIVVLGSAGALNVFTVDWQTNLGLALGGALLSYATSIVSAGVGNHNSPSLVPTEGDPNA
jgi:F0F1-type ATP synthase membrane subunit a